MYVVIALNLAATPVVCIYANTVPALITQLGYFHPAAELTTLELAVVNRAAEVEKHRCEQQWPFTALYPFTLGEGPQRANYLLQYLGHTCGAENWPCEAPKWVTPSALTPQLHRK